ncbi:hypothetical protein AAMO2058_001235900 [Amorphochlora amoebiformis]|eukprot:1215378-Amorphochlora_amoeboformis.AAC.2
MLASVVTAWCVLVTPLIGAVSTAPPNHKQHRMRNALQKIVTIPTLGEWKLIKEQFDIPSGLDSEVSAGKSFDEYHTAAKDAKSPEDHKELLDTLHGNIVHYFNAMQQKLQGPEHEKAVTRVLEILVSIKNARNAFAVLCDAGNSGKDAADKDGGEGSKDAKDAKNCDEDEESCGKDSKEGGDSKIPTKAEWTEMKKELNIPSGINPTVSAGASLEEYHKAVAEGKDKEDAAKALGKKMSEYYGTMALKMAGDENKKAREAVQEILDSIAEASGDGEESDGDDKKSDNDSDDDSDSDKSTGTGKIPTKAEWTEMKKKFKIPSGLNPEVSAGASLEEYHKSVADGKDKEGAAKTLGKKMSQYFGTLALKMPGDENKAARHAVQEILNNIVDASGGSEGNDDSEDSDKGSSKSDSEKDSEGDGDDENKAKAKKKVLNVINRAYKRIGTLRAKLLGKGQATNSSIEADIEALSNHASRGV